MLMSGLGHSRRFCDVRGRSTYQLTAAPKRKSLEVSNGPTAGTAWRVGNGQR